MIQQEINVLVSAEERRRLPEANRPILFICNRQEKGWDEQILDIVLRPCYPNLTILTISKSQNPFLRVQEAIAERNFQLLIKILKNTLERANAQTPIALPLNFDEPTPGDVLHQINLNRFFKLIRDAGFIIVLIHISPPQNQNRFERLLKEVRKILGNHFINRIPPQYHNDITVRISPPINTEELHRFTKAHQIRRFIQSRLFAMSGNMSSVLPNFFNFWTHQKPANTFEEIAEGVDKQSILTEIAALIVSEKMVISQSNFEVFVAEAHQIPHILQEIGRLREQTFRAIGEGTGLRLDLDDFDLYYRQLIIWDRTEGRIVGGYRIGCGDEIMRTYGKHGFYISTLFRIKQPFVPILERSLELGRSYIIDDYQRKPLPLFLLWKGILHFINQNPQFKYVYGPVSISRQFSDVSRGLMVEFLKKHYFDAKLALHLAPRKPFKIKKNKVDTQLLIETFGGELTNLDKFIEGIEPTQTRMPVLLRQYIRQNAKFIGFNLDPHFSDCLDGFMILDLKNLPASTIENLQREKQTTV